MASFSEAFRDARKRLGAGKTFTWNGKTYSTNMKGEGNSKPSKPTAAQRPKARPAAPVSGASRSTANKANATAARVSAAASVRRPAPGASLVAQGTAIAMQNGKDEWLKQSLRPAPPKPAAPAKPTAAQRPVPRPPAAASPKQLASMTPKQRADRNRSAVATRSARRTTKVRTLAID